MNQEGESERGSVGEGVNKEENKRVPFIREAQHSSNPGSKHEHKHHY